MKASINSGTRTDNPHCTHIIGKFEVDGCRYRIIQLDANGTGAVELQSDGGSDAKCPLCRFNIGGRTCAVVLDDDPAPGEERDPLELLTQREVQIATLVAMGRLNKQIANQLHISEWTVATHLRRMFAKLCVDTRAAMVYRCASLIGKRHP